MTPLQPLPNPSDEPDATPDPDVDTAETFRRAASARTGRWSFKRPSLHSRDRSSEPNIAVPAPAQLDREIPAGDADEHGRLSSWDHIDDLKAADQTRLEICNAHARLMKRMRRLIVVEQQLLDELDARTREREDSQRRGEELARAAAETGDTDMRAAAILREKAHRARRHAAEAAQHERRCRHQLARVRLNIEATPKRIYDEVEAIIGHHDHDRSERRSRMPHRYGMWTTPENTGQEKGREPFTARFGELPIDTLEQIAGEIERLRQAVRRVGDAEEASW